MKLFLIILFLINPAICFPQSIVEFEKPRIDLFKKHLEILASDLFEGRGLGTKGGELAANYIANYFQKIGLLPIGDHNSFYQNVPMHGTSYLYESKLFLYSNQDTIELKIDKDYILIISGEQTIIPKPTEIEFVGYGIIAPEFDYNDYLEKDVEGKIVLMIDGEPESENSEFFNGIEPTIYGHFDIKHRIAISRGAVGTIIIPNLIFEEEQWKKLKDEYSFENVELSYNASNNFGIILKPSKAKELFLKSNGQSLENLFQKENFNSGYSLTFDGEFYQRDFKSPNIVGMLKSNKDEINDEYIIVSAHYDHLGVGPEINRDKIYNGALDNAMGVSALLEIARILKLNINFLQRSIIFIATTGEEKGLLGSTYYVDHPIFPLFKTVANINIDGIAFIDKFNSIIGIGADYSGLKNQLIKTAKNFNLNITNVPSEFYSTETFNRSDQIAFAKAGIPSILILDGPDYLSMNRETAINKLIYYNNSIYHTPFDDLSIDFNFNASAQHIQILSSFIYDISKSDEKIDWNKDVSYNYIRLQTKAEKR